MQPLQEGARAEHGEPPSRPDDHLPARARFPHHPRRQRPHHHDVDLARTISAIALELAITAEPTAVTQLEITIDALDIPAIKPFWEWEAVLGYQPDRDDDSVDPSRRGPAFWFQQMDAPRPQRNCIHIDVTVPHDVAEQRIAAALAAGGTLVSDAAAPAFWVLADPEGNEACICTWQSRE